MYKVNADVLNNESREYIDKRLTVQIEWYNGKAKARQRRFKACGVLVVVISALIPVSVLFSDVNTFVVNVVVAGLGAAVSIASGLMSLGKYHDDWIRYRYAAELLICEKTAYDANMAPYDDPAAKFARLFDRCEKIIEDERNEWLNVRKGSAKPSPD